MTIEALAPFRVAVRRGPSGDPQPLPYLDDAARTGERGAIDI